MRKTCSYNDAVSGTWCVDYPCADTTDTDRWADGIDNDSVRNTAQPVASSREIVTPQRGSKQPAINTTDLRADRITTLRRRNEHPYLVLANLLEIAIWLSPMLCCVYRTIFDTLRMSTITRTAEGGAPYHVDTVNWNPTSAMYQWADFQETGSELVQVQWSINTTHRSRSISKINNYSCEPFIMNANLTV